MRTLISTKFQFKRSLKAVIIFYGILFVVFGLIFIPDIVSATVDQDGNSNIEMTASIFLFVIGLNSYKEDLKFALVNGCSRKTLFSAGAINLLSLAGLMAFIDTILAKILVETIEYKTMLERIYNHNYGTILGMLEGFLFAFAIYSFSALIGYFITTLYYRINKILKVAVSVGVPVFFTMVLPYIDMKLEGAIFRAIGIFLTRVFGLYNTVNAYIAIASLFGGVVILLAFTFLLARKAPIKD